MPRFYSLKTSLMRLTLNENLHLKENDIILIFSLFLFL